MYPHKCKTFLIFSNSLRFYIFDLSDPYETTPIQRLSYCIWRSVLHVVSQTCVKTFGILSPSLFENFPYGLKVLNNESRFWRKKILAQFFFAFKN